MNFYEVDILDTNDGTVRKTPMPTGWTGEPSLWMYRHKMCDCNLKGYRDQCSRDPLSGELKWFTAYNEKYAYPLSKTCDHSMPPTRYKALRAYLADGTVVNIETGETERAAA